MAEWISVKDRLPEKLEPVNVVWKNMDPDPYYADIKGKPFVATAYYYNDQWWWFSATCTEYLELDADKVDEGIAITHWMPLPSTEGLEHDT